MVKALKIIRSEHAGLAAIYRTMTAILKDVEEGKSEPNFELLYSLVHYLKSFMYTFHHPKENQYLFPAVSRHSPGAANLVEKLEAQHKEGGHLLLKLEQALEKYEQTGNTGMRSFLDAFERYHQFEWKHMSLEEKEILPLARRCIPEEEWAPIDKAFTDHNDPIFGDDRRDEFKTLFEEILRIAPPPYGLGK